MPKFVKRSTAWRLNYAEILNRLEHKRAELNLTRRAMCLEIGLEPSHYSFLENRKDNNSMSTNTLIAIASWLEVNPSQFFFKVKL